MLKTRLNIYVFVALLMLAGTIGFSQKKRTKYVNSPLMQPAYLQKGDTVMILATAGIIKDEEILNNAVDLLKSWGLKVRIGKNTLAQDNHFAGTDAQRALDFQDALDDSSVKAIWCARGGYGTVRMIDKVNFTRFEKNPKWIIGFSDVTVIHNEIHNLGIESLHAMMPSTLNLEDDERKKAIISLKKALFGEELAYKTSKSDFNKKGEGRGQLVGGNLSILYSLLGSKSSIKTDGKILFIEDLGEYVYHIDRMLQNLKRNGYFKNCEGLIVGSITDIRENDTDFGKAVEQVILDVVADYDFPVAFNFPAGHIRDNRTLIMGREVALKVKNKKATIEFSESYRSKKKTSQISSSPQETKVSKAKPFEGKINLGPGVKG